MKKLQLSKRAAEELTEEQIESVRYFLKLRDIMIDVMSKAKEHLPEGLSSRDELSNLNSVPLELDMLVTSIARDREVVSHWKRFGTWPVPKERLEEFHRERQREYEEEG